MGRHPTSHRSHSTSGSPGPYLEDARAGARRGGGGVGFFTTHYHPLTHGSCHPITSSWAMPTHPLMLQVRQLLWRSTYPPLSDLSEASPLPTPLLLRPTSNGCYVFIFYISLYMYIVQHKAHTPTKLSLNHPGKPKSKIKMLAHVWLKNMAICINRCRGQGPSSPICRKSMCLIVPRIKKRASLDIISSYTPYPHKIGKGKVYTPYIS
jgi:hypothetical protein